MIAGQFLDVSAQARGAADVDAAMTVLRYKSAKYSIERPLHIGAALAGADAAAAELTAFGLPLGEAFQLRDDLLGVFGDAATTGKPAGDDLVEGKRTVLVALALDAAAPEDAAAPGRRPGHADLGEEQVARLREVIDGSGAHAQVEDVITARSGRAVAALERADVDPAARRCCSSWLQRRPIASSEAPRRGIPAAGWSERQGAVLARKRETGFP